MDLSAVIFVVLALAWAGYLIPKALRHHDDVASDRLDEGHTERVRVLKRTRDRDVVAEPEPQPEPQPKPQPKRERKARREPSPVVVPMTRTAARTAARRRRRVLAVLLLVLAVTTGLAVAAYLPMWSPAVPGALVLLFLVVARLSVRGAQRSSLARRRTAPEQVAPIEVGDEIPVAVEVPVAPRPVRFEEEREEAEALADDGSLWDPLPMTLPTYVTKARARRTVRTIELTGMQSSGHSESDSALAREAEQHEADAEAGADTATRKVAGA